MTLFSVCTCVIKGQYMTHLLIGKQLSWDIHVLQMLNFLFLLQYITLMEAQVKALGWITLFSVCACVITGQYMTHLCYLMTRLTGISLYVCCVLMGLGIPVVFHDISYYVCVYLYIISWIVLYRTEYSPCQSVFSRLVYVYTGDLHQATVSSCALSVPNLTSVLTPMPN